MAKVQDIVIVGCGRLGAVLANQLSVDGHRLAIIDRRQAMFEKLSFDFSGYTIVGDATEMAVLRAAKLDKADYLFAVTSSDNTNLMVAQVATHIFKVKQVVARVFDPSHVGIYETLKIDIISPTQLASNAFMSRLNRAEPLGVES